MMRSPLNNNTKAQTTVGNNGTPGYAVLHHWPLTETAQDIIDYGSNHYKDHGLTPNASFATGTTAVDVSVDSMPWNWARQFNGTSDWMRPVAPQSGYYATFSVAFWMKPEAQAAVMSPLSCWRTAPNVGIQPRIQKVNPGDTPGIYCIAYMVDATYRSTGVYFTGYTYSPGDWVFVALTYDGYTMRAYAQGDLIGENTYGTYQETAFTPRVPFPDHTAEWTIGNIPAGGFDYYKGHLAHARAIDGVMSPWEIKQEYVALTSEVGGFDIEGDSIAIYNHDQPADGTTNGTPVVDLTGSHSGTVVSSGTVPIEAGIGGRARYCASNLNYANIPSHADFSLQNDKTVECFFTWTSSLTTDGGPFAKWNGGAQKGFRLVRDGAGPLKVQVSDGTTTIEVIDSSNVVLLEVRRWIYAVMTWNASSKRLRLFLNGTFIGESTDASLVNADTDNADNYRFGSAGAGGAIRVGPQRITSREKTPEEIYNTFHGAGISRNNA